MKLIVMFAALVAAVTPGVAADLKAGEAVYARSCKMCHGPDGRGNAVMAKALDVTQPLLGSVTPVAVKNAIKNGKGKMKAVNNVEGDEIPDLVAFLRTLPKQ
jgi:mono/diheme cytochrome c family protein